jgi:hypothetical protein
MHLGRLALLVLLAAPVVSLAQDAAGTCAAPGPPVAIAGREQAGVRWRDLGLTVAALALAVGGLAYVRANERWRRRDGSAERKLDVPPYATGAALGIVIAVSLTAFAEPVGVSGAFQNLAGSLGRVLAPGIAYWQTGIPTGVTWQVWVVLGLFAGAMLGAAMSRSLRVSRVPEAWVQTFGPSIVRRWLLAFLAGALIELASAIAGGCTSGLALSGGIVLAPGAFLFMAAMFGTGIPTAWLVLRLTGRAR